MKPKLLLLDEPFSQLDYQSRLSIASDVYKLVKENNITTILVTHDMSIVLKVATDVVTLKEGKVAYQGNPHSLFKLSSEELSLDIPPLYRFAKLLLDKGLDIDLDKIQSIDDLVKEIGGKYE